MQLVWRSAFVESKHNFKFNFFNLNGYAVDKQLSLNISPPRTVFSVTEIANTINRIIQKEPILQNVWVRGQVSNLSRPNSGHIYFTLKDERNSIRCIIWNSNKARIKYVVQDGDEVLVHGKINTYPANSIYQINVTQVEPLGVGSLQRAYEQLKQRLSDEGLFDQQYKKPLPVYPKKIGVITSETGAAIQDIIRQLSRRYPLAELLLHPSLVQGEGAAGEIANAILAMNKRTDIDVLIVGRGGGSIEDLWAFNEEIVARAIFKSRIPVVSAVGHESDHTISDMVADHRSSTPSTAIEDTVPDRLELLTSLNSVKSRLHELIKLRLHARRDEVEGLYKELSPTNRLDSINQLSQIIDSLETTYLGTMKTRMKEKKTQLQSLADQLNNLSPLATLNRGYSLCRDSSGSIITSSQDVKTGDSINVTLSQGSLTCSVDKCRD